MKLVEINRKINIYTWISLLVIILIISICLLATYQKKNEVVYLYYKENADIDYKVNLNDNKYYDEEYLEKDNQYISDLIKDISAKFNYKLEIDDAIEYTYKYRLVANINVIDKDTNKILYTSSDELVPEKIGDQKGNLELEENIDINYKKYNNFVNEFVNTYNLKNSISKLSAIMYVELEGKNESINENENSTISLNIPLNQNTFYMDSNSNLITHNNNLIEIVPKKKNSTILLKCSITFLIIDLVLLLGLIRYIKNSETEEDKYSSQLKKILNKYESCISKVEEEFNMTDYRMIKMQRFIDLLEIRDTMRLPIIMIENKEKLMACFMITTDNNVLYFYSIGVTQYAFPVNNENQEKIKVDQKNEN